MEDCIVINFWDTHVVAHLCLSADIMHVLDTGDDTLALPLLPIVWPFVLDDSGQMKEPCKRSIDCSMAVFAVMEVVCGRLLCGSNADNNRRLEERCFFCLNS